VRLQLRDQAGIGGEERVARDVLQPLERDLDLAQGTHPADEADAVRSRSHLRATAPAATVGAVSRADARPPPRGSRSAVLAPVGVVGMAGAEGVEKVAVVLAALVGVADQQRDRRAGGQPLVDAREDLHRVGLAALRHVAAGAGAAPVELDLDVGSASASPGGQPSITQPMAGPWLSPKLVTREEFAE
jgi:hypothetical protein